MAQVPSNLIPTRVTQLQYAPTASEDSLLLIVYDGSSYKIRAGDLLAVAGVPTSRQVLAGTGLTGGGALSSNVTLSIANGGVGPTQLSITGVSAGAYGSATAIPVLTIDANGRVTAATTIAPVISSVAGGAANRILYQTSADHTGFISAPTLANTVLQWNGTGFVWSPAASGSVSSVTASLPISSSGGTAPNISISQATATTNGYLSSSDWSTFNNKQEGLTLTTVGTSGPATLVGGILNVPNYNPGAAIVTSVTATSPVVSSGGSTPNISMDAATGSVNGYLTSVDWTTFNSKQPAGAYLTTVTANAPLTGLGTAINPLSIPVASSSASGYLSATDWTTFNSKGAGTVISVSGTTGRITSTGGTTPVIDLSSGIVTAGTTGSSALIPVITVDTYGRVTSITTASNPQGTVTSISTAGSVNGITLTGGPITSTGTITLGGTLSGVSLTTQVTGTLPVGNGGTGATTLTGYVKGNGSSTMTASSTIPNTDITGLGTMSTQNASSVAITGGSINGTTIGAGTPAAGTFTNVTLTTGTISTTPTAGNDIVNKSYADSIASGVNYHPAVQYASAATLTSTSGAYTYNNGTSGVGATLTGAINAALVVDGHTMVASDVTAGTRVLLKNETGAYVNTTTPSAAFNGAYVVTQIATVSVGWVLTRATDYDTSGSGTNEIDQGDFFYVVYGTANTNTSWIQQTPLPITVGTTSLTFVQFGAATFYTAGTGLTLSGSNQFSITNTGITANTYGSASNVPVLTVNAQGQLTSVTNTPIAINVSAVTGAVTGVTATAPVVSSGGTAPVISMAAASGSTNGYLTSTDWTTFNSKGTGTVTAVSIVSANGFAGTSSGGATPQLTLTTTITGLLKGNGTAISAATSGVDYAPATSGTSILYGNNAGGFSNVTIGSGISFSGGTLSATGSGGTVTSVTATAPVVSSGGTTPVISMAAASSSVSGYLTSTDWTTFNNKGNINSVTGTAPVSVTSGDSPVISMAAANSTTNGYLSSTDWTTFNNKGSGSVTSVAALTLGTSGTDLNSTVANSTTTPVITLNVPTASASNRGALSSTDWTTFNSKQDALVNTSNIRSVNGNSLLGSGNVSVGTVTSVTGTAPVVSSGGTTPAISMAAASSTTDGYLTSTDWNTFNSKGSGTITGSGTTNYVSKFTSSTAIGSSVIYDDGTNVGIGTGSPSYKLHISGTGYASSDFRTPILYDSDNTAYYADPASTSISFSSNGIVSSGVGTSGGLQNRVFTSGRNRIWSFGNADSWGISYFQGGPDYIGLHFGTATQAASQFWVSDSGISQTSGSSRAPVFYDSDNTGYYLNPNGGSNLDSVVTNEVYTNGWFRNNSANCGLYSQVHLNHWYASTSGYWNLAGTNNNYCGIVFRTDGHQTTPRGFVYADNGNNIGFLNQDASWRLRVVGGDYTEVNGSSIRAPIYYDINNTGYYADPASTSVFNALTLGGRATTYAMYYQGFTLDANTMDTNSTGFTYAVNAPYVGPIARFSTNGGYDLWINSPYNGNGCGFAFRTRNGDAGSFNSWQYPAVYGINANGGGSLYTTILYDQDDTGYYVNPNGNSRINYIGVNSSDFYGVSYFYSNLGSYSGSLSNPALQVFSTSGNAAFMSFHRGGYYAVNMGLDADNVLRIGGWSASANRLQLDMSGNLWTASSMRTSVFYDQDNTGYYVDPASTSNLYYLAVDRAASGYDSGQSGSFSCSNWFRSSGNTGWYNASYSGGVFMTDPTWVRIYGSKAFYVDNQIAATGNITAYYSDERLKTKTSKIENPLEKISKLEGFHYVENELAKSLGYTNDRQQVGLSAQQVQSVLPEAVSLAPVDMHTDEFSGKITSKSGENYLTVDYSRLVPLLVEAIKEQQAQIEELKNLIRGN